MSGARLTQGGAWVVQGKTELEKTAWEAVFKRRLAKRCPGQPTPGGYSVGLNGCAGFVFDFRLPVFVQKFFRSCVVSLVGTGIETEVQTENKIFHQSVFLIVDVACLVLRVWVTAATGSCFFRVFAVHKHYRTILFKGSCLPV